MTKPILTGVTDHFIARAVERIGCDKETAFAIGRGIIEAVRQDRRDLVEFVCRTSRDGNRVFRFRYGPNGALWYAIVNTDQMSCITVLTPGRMVGRVGKAPMHLRDYDL